MTLNRISKLKSEDVMNTWTHAVIGKPYKKQSKALIQRRRRAVIRQDTQKEIKTALRTV